MKLEMQPMSWHDRFGRRVAARLTLGTEALGNDIDERLRIARQQAVARRKVAGLVAASGVVRSGGSAALQFGDGGPAWWTRLASAVPLLALAVGLLVIHVVQSEDRANELAEVDAALLTDDLPTSAYTDPGFLQFLKTDTAPASQE